MRAAHILVFIALFGIASMGQTYKCLGPDVNEDDVASVRTITSKAGETRTERITVRQTLKKMKARCVRGQLVDANGRQIRFYFLKGCWGNPPADYLEILDKQRKEIKELKKRYTVIEVTCNPNGLPPQSIS